jgi:hypothetical protein
MEQGAGDRFRIELHPGQNGGHFNRVKNVRLPRFSAIRTVRRDRKFTCPPNEVDVCVRGALADGVDQRVERGANFGQAAVGIGRRSGGRIKCGDRSVKTVSRGDGYCPRWHANLCACVTE